MLSRKALNINFKVFRCDSKFRAVLWIDLIGERRRFFVWWEHFATRGSSDVDVRFWCKKTLDFSKFMMWPQGQGERGLSQCGHFVSNGKGEPIFRDFERTSFYGRPLIHSFSKYSC